MRTTKWIAAVALVATALACHREKALDPAPPASAASEAAAPPAVQPTQAEPSRPELQPQASRLEVGYGADSSGAVLQGLRSRQFNAGTLFVLGVRADDLAPGTEVVATFTGPAGEPLATLTKTTVAGARYLSFTSPDTSAWPEGDVRVEVSFKGGAQGTIAFRIDRPKGSPA